MRLNTRTLKNYPDDTKFKNVVGTFLQCGSRAIWGKIPGVVTKEQVLKEREWALSSCKGVRYDGELVEGDQS